MGAERGCQGARVAAHPHGWRDHPNAIASEFCCADRGAAAGSREGQLHAHSRLRRKVDQLRLNQARKLIEQGIECLVLVGEVQPAGMLICSHRRAFPTSSPTPAAGETGTPASGSTISSRPPGSPNTCLASATTISEWLCTRRRSNDRIQQRIEGFSSTLARAGIAIRPQHFVRANSRFIASGRDGMRHVLQAAAPHPTAVVCTNDYIATGAIIEAKELGFAVPDDLSIVGFDDTDMSAHLDPPLTTIRVPSRLMGQQLAKYIVALLETGKAACPPPLDAEMIIRRSTAPPRQV